MKELDESSKEELLPKCLWEAPSEDACSPKAIKFIAMWKGKTEDERRAELKRLVGIENDKKKEEGRAEQLRSLGIGGDMALELKKWVQERMRILEQSVTEDKTEL